MSHTLKLTFNVQSKIFELGYLNYELDKSVRNSLVNCYYLAINTRLSQFIKFLASISPEQEHNSKINSIRQIVLKITYARRGQVFYSLIIKGDTTGVMTFKPSEFKDYQEDVEPDILSLEPLVESIINEKPETDSSEQDIMFICKEIVNISDFTSEKIKQLRDLLSK